MQVKKYFVSKIAPTFYWFQKIWIVFLDQKNIFFLTVGQNNFRKKIP